MTDLDERAWWVFQTPGSVVHVPAASEDEGLTWNVALTPVRSQRFITSSSDARA